ncbi:metal-dependent protein hydrolase [Saitoella complicata NRRL Y-17804]|uniref:metal-dependent protein hydrolase n=1 Tax=Saitoella complicata (strain BCRC 22490 / CBS 7301 / JCM 7358 / NBRC 10748 / NRRL Y-17804) TaxID=698492 RepID=UPI000867EED2|nr:metal-dependent protein hydrolase [Saitoella complicata NRRL Y-17804]ODQ52922.1 metal-dependent protein hydrolase [Saitoella complicata NRRL Y-17804]
MARIGTHSGTFHCDEALAVYMLRLLPKYKDATVTRSRDPAVLEECDIIVDVTGQYDGVKHFDHHQREFNEFFSPQFQNTKLSSAGLVYKHFGEEIIREQLGLEESDSRVKLIHNKVYAEFVEAVDANDNGVSPYPADVKPTFKDRLSIPGMVAHLNPWWNQPFTDEILDAQFQKASELVGAAFIDRLNYYGRAWLPARDLVFRAIDSRRAYDPEGRIVVFDEFLPWKDHLFQIEAELQVPGQILYVVYSDGKGYRVQAVPESPESFKSRKPLPENWRGVRDQALSDLTGIPGCVFVHAAGFIGGNATREGALEMAIKALDME